MRRCIDRVKQLKQLMSLLAVLLRRKKLEDAFVKRYWEVAETKVMTNLGYMGGKKDDLQEMGGWRQNRSRNGTS